MPRTIAEPPISLRKSDHVEVETHGDQFWPPINLENRMNKTHLYVDTEFNGFAGELISLGIFEPLSLSTFYSLVKVPENPHPWVLEHVLSKTEGEEVLGEELTRKSLWDFTKSFDNVVFVADWPEDLGHVAMLMCGPDGFRPSIQFEMKLIKSRHQQLTNPHHALADARDLGTWAHANKFLWI